MHSHDWRGTDLSRLFGTSLIYPAWSIATAPPVEAVASSSITDVTPTSARVPAHSCLLFDFFWPYFCRFFPLSCPTRSFSWKRLLFELQQMCYLALALGLLSQENTFAALLDIIFHRQPGGRIVLCCYLYSLPMSQVCVYCVSPITILCLL